MSYLLILIFVTLVAGIVSNYKKFSPARKKNTHFSLAS